MRYFYKIALFSILLFVTTNTANATHIVGGEITYSCLGGNQYEIFLTIFRDCYTGIPDFDQPAQVTVFSDKGIRLDSFQMFFTYRDTLKPTLTGECYVVPPNVCVNTTTYRKVVTLPFREGGYILSYQRCCRNESIKNIVQPLDAGATYMVEITEDALRDCNSSPKFKNWPPLYICVNTPLVFDHSATDLEGDSIVYSLYTPFIGADPDNPMPSYSSPPPYSTVTFIDPPYSEANMMGGVPLAIDPHTGIMTATPNVIGQFVVGVYLKEYRNGKLLSIVRRDFQYNVGQCGNPVSSFFSPELQCNGLTVNFKDQSQKASKYFWSFDANNPGATSGLPNPSYTYPDTGTYTVTLVIESSAKCRDTSEQTIKVYRNTLNALFDFNLPKCDDSVTITAINKSIDNESDIDHYKWIVVSGSESDTIGDVNLSYTTSRLTDTKIYLIAVSETGCSDTIEYTVPSKFIYNFLDNDTIKICPGASIRINNNGSFPGTYSWSPQTWLIEDINTSNPLAKPEDSIQYVASVINGLGCTDRDTVNIKIADKLPDFAAVADPDLIAEGLSSQLLVTPNDGYSFEWTPPGSLNDPHVHDPVASPHETTTYTVFIQNEFGCHDTASVTVRVISLCDEPYIFIPTAFTPNNDKVNNEIRVHGIPIFDMRLEIYDRWGQKVFESTNPELGWNGTYKGSELPADVYGYQLTVRCINGKSYYKKGNISLLR